MADDLVTTPLTETMLALREQMTTPLMEQLSVADERIGALTLELSALRVQRRELDRMLRALTGESTPGPKGPRNSRELSPHERQMQRGAPVTQERIDAVLAYLDSIDTSNGFTVSDIDKGHRAGGGEPRLSQPTVSLIVDHLHKTGVVRFDRNGKGGSRIYKMVGAS
jgi:hypothetical protein